jgi:ribosome-binding factor A
MGRRLQRLNTQFQRELSDLIRTELRDPRIGAIVSITRVDLSPDLENATVYTSVLAEEESKRATMGALTSAAPFLRRHLIERMRIKKVPQLHFVLDETIEQAARVLELMKRAPQSD